jgi:hypothetical protein
VQELDLPLPLSHVLLLPCDFAPPAEMAKLARRKPAPVYAERVYDTVSRATPTALERVLYAKVGRTFSMRKKFTLAGCRHRRQF